MSVLKFPHLFEPLIIGDTVFRNRIFASPQGSSYLDADEFPTPEVTVYYERKAIGGAATTCMGVRSVDPVAGLGLASYTEGLERLVRGWILPDDEARRRANFVYPFEK